MTDITHEGVLFEHAMRNNPFTYLVRTYFENGGQITQSSVDEVLRVLRKDLMVDRKDGAGRLRPSMIGNECVRQQMLSMFGAEQDKEDWDGVLIPELGTEIHFGWQLRGLASGALDQIEAKSSHAEWGVRINGSADGINLHPRWGFAWELKTVNKFKFDNVLTAGPKKKILDEAGEETGMVKTTPGPLPEHAMQVQALLPGLPVDRYSLLYVHRDTGKYIEILIHRDEEVQGKLRDLCQKVLRHSESGTLPAELAVCKARRNKAPYSYCDYKGICPRAAEHFGMTDEEGAEE